MTHDENKKTGMPYRESNDYLESLIASCTERAVNQQHGSRPEKGRAAVRPLWRMMTTAAAALAVLIIGVWMYVHHQDTLRTEAEQGPLQEFLAEISDAEAQQIVYYEIEEITGYEEQ